MLDENKDPDKTAEIVFDGEKKTVVYVKNKFVCTFCPYVAANRGALTFHNNYYHLDKECPDCKQVFKWEEGQRIGCSKVWLGFAFAPIFSCNKLKRPKTF